MKGFEVGSTHALAIMEHRSEDMFDLLPDLSVELRFLLVI